MALDDRKAPVVFVTGAGASAPLGYPVTSRFFEGILKAECEPTEHVPQLGDGPTGMLRGAVVFSHGHDYDPKSCDIELVLSVLATAASDVQENKWAHFVHRGRQVTSNTANLLNAMEAFQRDWDTSYSAAAEAYDWLVERIWDAYGGKEIGSALDSSRDQEGVSTLELYGPLFASLGRHLSVGIVKELPIFTLNYDLSIDRMLANSQCWQGILGALGTAAKQLKVDNGFVEDGMLTGQYFWDPTGSALPPPNDLTVSVFYRKLHGSLNWSRQHITGGERIQWHRSLDRHVPTQEPVLMHPIPVKARPSESPFWEMYRELSARLAEARLCIVIGCSLRDPSVVDALAEAYDTNDALRVALVMPDEPEDNPELARFLERYGDRATQVKCYFGKDDYAKKIDVEIAKALA